MPVSKSDQIVVTGGAGFLGSFVVEKLKSQGYERITIPLESTESPAIVAAMSRALATLADRIVGAM